MRRFKQVLLLYHIENRERIINEMYKQCIEEEHIADEVVIAEMYTTLLFDIQKYHPDLVISYLPRDEVSTAGYTLAKYVWNCFWISIPTEGFFELNETVLHTYIGFNLTPACLVDKYLFFGSGVADATKLLLRKYNKIYDYDQIDSFGYLPYETRLMEKYRKDYEIVKKIKKLRKGYKKIVLFVLAYMSKDSTLSEYIGESAVDVDDVESLHRAKSIIDANSYYSDKYIELILSASLACPDCLFLLKKHPVEMSYKCYKGTKSRYDVFESVNNVIIIDEPIQISNFLSISDVFVNYGSTSSMEAYVYRVPSILLLNDYNDSVKDCYGRQVPSQISMSVSCVDIFIETIKTDLEFTENEAIEEELKMYVNYISNKAYDPSRKFKSVLVNMPDDPMTISLFDSQVRIVIKGKEFSTWIRIIAYQTIRRFWKFGLFGIAKRFLIVFKLLLARVRSASK